MCIYSLHRFSFNVDWFGASLILPKMNAYLFRFGNIQIQVILITPVRNVFNLLVVYCIFIITNFSNQFCIICKFYYRTWLISASTVSCIQSKQKGAKTVRWGAPVFVLIADDSNQFSLTYWSLLVRYYYLEDPKNVTGCVIWNPLEIFSGSIWKSSKKEVTIVSRSEFWLPR